MSYSAIAYCFAARKPKRKDQCDDVGTDWHQWVYGGMRRPA